MVLRSLFVLSLWVSPTWAANPMDGFCRGKVIAIGESLGPAGDAFQGAAALYRIMSGLSTAPQVMGHFFRPQAEQLTLLGMRRLAELGVEAKLRISTDPAEGLEIIPGEGNALSEFAKQMKERYNTVVLYSPLSLYKAEAGFNGSPPTIRLSHENVLRGNIDVSTLHEGLHAYFDFLERNGSESLFHGHMITLKEGTPMWDNPGYREYMTFEELGIYPDTIKRRAEDLADLIRRKLPPRDVTVVYQQLVENISQAKDNYHHTGKVLDRVIKDPSKIEIFSSQRISDGGALFKMYIGRVHIDNMEMDIPLVKLEDLQGPLRESFEKKLRENPNPDKTFVFHDLLREMAVKRLTTLRGLCGELEGKMLTLERTSRDPNKIADFVRLSREPLSLVEPYFDKTSK